MGAEEYHRFIPDHAVPMTMEKLVKSTSERVGFGTLDVVRVHIMGIVTSCQFDECHVDFELKDPKNTHRISVQKLLTSSFTKDQSLEIRVDDYVEVFGKVRMFENDRIYLNAFSIRKASETQYAAFQPICAFAEEYYESNSPCLPPGSSTLAPQSIGLKNKIGSLNRFPIGMLEESTSVENNLGIWPSELEELAAEIHIQRESSSEEEQDSFDEGPIRTKGAEPEPEPLDDSFDAIP